MPTPEAQSKRLERLEAAIARLSENVVGLSTALALVGEIQERQNELEQQSAALKKEAIKASTMASASETANQATREEVLTLREANHRRLLGVLSLLALMLMLIGYTRYQSVKQIDSRIDATYGLCNASNAHIQYEIGLISQSKTPDRVALAKAIKGLEDLKQDCDKKFGEQAKPHFLGTGTG